MRQETDWEADSKAELIRIGICQDGRSGKVVKIAVEVFDRSSGLESGVVH